MTDIPPRDSLPMKNRTKLVHAGRHPGDQHGFVNTPVYRGSTVLFPTLDDFWGRKARFSYGTQGTPTTEALESAWTELAGAAGTVLAPTGLAAITLALLTVVKSGGHILVTDAVYRPSRHFCDTVLSRLGVETTYYDPLLGSGIEVSHQVEHKRDLHRDARLADLRGPGRSGDCRARPRQGHLHHSRQHLGDALVLSAACARRRYGGRSRYQISWRALPTC